MRSFGSFLSHGGTRPFARHGGAILLSVVLVVGGIGMAGSVASADQRVFVPESRLTQVQARPGDTLWSFAARATPEGGDVSDTVSLIRRINHLHSSRIGVGQVLRVPKIAK